MKFCGNYKNLIKKEWIEVLLKTKGIEISPFRDKDPKTQTYKIKEKNLALTDAVNESQENLFIKGPYDDSLIMAEIFDNRNCPFDLDLGELNEYLGGDWWIVKQLPGQFMPLHRDTCNSHENNHRFWMPWFDYQIGHIFIHETKFISNYRAGDLYQYYQDSDLHGSANISSTPRIVLQMSQKTLL